MFTVTVDHTSLKGVLEWIIDQLNNQRGDIGDLRKLLDSKVQQIET